MKFFYAIIAGLMNYFYDALGGYVPGICVLAALAELLNIGGIRQFFRGAKNKEHYQELLVRIREKKKNRADANKDIMTVLVKEKYPIAGYSMVSLFQMIIGLLLALTLRNGAAYFRDPASLNVDSMCVMLTRSPLNVLREFGDNTETFVGIAAVMIPMCLQGYHNNLTSGYLVTDQGAFQTASLAISFVMLALLPEGLGIYWAVAKMLDVMVFLLTMRKKA